LIVTNFDEGLLVEREDGIGKRGRGNKVGVCISKFKYY
jgi:hypothetical protein